MMYYDFVLGLIPFGLATIASTLFFTGFELTLAVTVACLFAVVVIGHAMFVRAPVDAPTPVSESPAPAATDGPMMTAD
jgi:peptidoglycan biosynthesis protein MviN/MurJ (putative lipid II flippase)